MTDAIISATVEKHESGYFLTVDGGETLLGPYESEDQAAKAFTEMAGASIKDLIAKALGGKVVTPQAD